MPRRKPENVSLPLAATTLTERWGRLLRYHRIKRAITIRDMTTRLGVSLVTLQRIERGEPSVQVGTYLNAMLVLGLLNSFCPSPLLEEEQSLRQRARPSKDDKDYF